MITGVLPRHCLAALTALILFASPTTHATVGGAEEIEVLGIAKDNKLYVLRHYYDASDRLPQLYYFNLSSKKPEKLITVHSLYINPTTNKPDYDSDDHNQFFKKLTTLQQRLTPLQPIDSSTIKLGILSLKTKQVVAWYDLYNDSKSRQQKDKVPQYHYRYQLTNTPLKSAPQTAISYQKDLRIHQAYALPNQRYQLAVVRYLGINFETGYHIDDAVLLK